MAKKGRKHGPTLLCDLWIEERAEYLCETGISLKTAIQYAVGDLLRYIASERHSRARYSTSEEYENHMRHLDAMLSVLKDDEAFAKRAEKRKKKRSESGWEILDTGYMPSYLLGPPDIASDSVTVKRNYERIAQKSR